MTYTDSRHVYRDVQELDVHVYREDREGEEGERERKKRSIRIRMCEEPVPRGVEDVQVWHVHVCPSLTMTSFKAHYYHYIQGLEGIFQISLQLKSLKEAGNPPAGPIPHGNLNLKVSLVR